MTLDLDCPSCGPVAVAVGLVELHVNRRDGFHLLTFVCPSCADLVARREGVSVEALAALGVAVRELRSLLPPLGADDLLDLHLLLQDDGWCARLAAGE